MPYELYVESVATEAKKLYMKNGQNVLIATAILIDITQAGSKKLLKVK